MAADQPQGHRMSAPAKLLNHTMAVELMQEGAALVQLHLPHGSESDLGWFVIGADGCRGRISDQTAEFLLQCNGVQPSSDRMFGAAAAFAVTSRADFAAWRVALSQQRRAERTTDMALGLKKTGDAILPILKYDAREGLIYVQDRVQLENGEWASEQKNVTKNFEAIFDLANTLVGWIKFPKGAAPECTLVPIGTDHGPAPSKDHKEGLRVLVKITGDEVGVRELLSTSLGLCVGLDELHDAFLEHADDHPDEVPVVRLADVIKNQTKQGVSVQPVFEIVGWRSRPKDLPATAAPLSRQASPKPAEGGDFEETAFGTAGKSAAKKRGDMDDEIPF
jgi:hypothetical protein